MANSTTTKPLTPDATAATEAVSAEAESAAHTPAAAPPAVTGVLSERLENVPERLLDLPSVLDDFVKANFVSQRQAEDILIAPRTTKELLQHPMEIIAAREYENRNDPGKIFDLETMTLCPHRPAENQCQHGHRSHVVCVRATPSHPCAGSFRR